MSQPDSIPSVSVTRLPHVRSREEIRAAEEIAQRTRCEDFGDFKSVFQKIQRDLETGARKTVKFQENAEEIGRAHV